MLWGRFRLRKATLIGAVAAIALTGSAPVAAQNASQATALVDVPANDARKIEPNSVRFSAAQLSRNAPTVVLFGATTPSWHKARSAMRQAVAQGYQISCVFMGPTDQPPSLEIYAKGHHVTNPINLNEISEAEITRLVRDVWREYYAR